MGDWVCQELIFVYHLSGECKSFFRVEREKETFYFLEIVRLGIRALSDHVVQVLHCRLVIPLIQGTSNHTLEIYDRLNFFLVFLIGFIRGVKLDRF
jgi:hypothetical protein